MECILGNLLQTCIVIVAVIVILIGLWTVTGRKAVALLFLGVGMLIGIITQSIGKRKGG